MQTSCKLKAEFVAETRDVEKASTVEGAFPKCDVETVCEVYKFVGYEEDGKSCRVFAVL